jgi:hypothetical protein
VAEEQSNAAREEGRIINSLPLCGEQRDRVTLDVKGAVPFSNTTVKGEACEAAENILSFLGKANYRCGDKNEHRQLNLKNGMGPCSNLSKTLFHGGKEGLSESAWLRSPLLLHYCPKQLYQTPTAAYRI